MNVLNSEDEAVLLSYIPLFLQLWNAFHQVIHEELFQLRSITDLDEANNGLIKNFYLHKNSLILS